MSLPVDGGIYKISVSGLQETVARLKRIGHKFNGSAHNRNAVSAAGGILRRAIETNVPRESGTLRSNIRVRIMRKKGTREFSAVVGARRKVRQRGSSSTKQAVRFTRAGVAKRISEKKLSTFTGRIAYRVPSRYLHLIERGTSQHSIATNKRSLVSAGGEFFGPIVNPSGISGRYPVAKAVRSKGEAAMAAAIEKLKSAIKKEAANG